MVFTLYDAPGPYPVGATTFAIPLDEFANPEDRVVGEAKVQASASGHPNQPALKLEEVAFTAFYPAELNPAGGGRKRISKGMGWIPKPVGGTLRGYAHFSKWSYWIVNWLLHIPAGLLKIPVYSNAPLLNPQSASDFKEASWPLVLFSHGLAGNRTNYSHVCARLASEGRVVLAFEHKDGSGPYVQTISPIPGRPATADASSDYKLYLHPEDVLWNEEIDKSRFPLRRDQLRFRRAEIYLGYSHFRKFVEGSLDQDSDTLSHPTIHTVDGPYNFSLTSSASARKADRAFWESWAKRDSRPKVRVERDVCLAGHSFGGATVLDVLSTPPPEFSGKKFSRIPFSHAIVLDPWMDPLPSPGPKPYIYSDEAPEDGAQDDAQSDVKSVPGEQSSKVPRLLVVNSEGFTLWDDHFGKLKAVVQAWNNASQESPSSSSSAQPAQLTPEPSSAKQDQDTNVIDDSKTSDPEIVSGPYATLITLLRAQHTSFSDFGVLVPFGRLAREGKLFLGMTGDLVSSFLQEPTGVESTVFKNELDKLKKVELKTEDINLHKPDSETEWKKRIVGEVGDVIVH